MILTHIDLATRLPSLGSRFVAGQNCESIEFADGVTYIRAPRQEGSQLLCDFDVIVLAIGWAKLPRANSIVHAPVAPLVCDECNRRFDSKQGLGSHRRHAHGGGE